MIRVGRSIILAVLAMLVAVGAAGCTVVSAPAPSNGAVSTTLPENAQASPASDFVTAKGRSFMVGGHPFRFVGVNIYDAASSDRYSCRPGSAMSDAQLNATLRYLHQRAGATVLRFWAYQTYTQGATYWGGVDRVLAAARANGMRVIPVLEDGPGDCTTSSDRTPKIDYQGDTWYTKGYTVPYGNASMSYRDYVAKITAHYRDNPTILGWSLMNEAETKARDAAGRSVLVDFARDVAGVIRSVDPRHLITLGTQSNGAPGASGPDFTAVYSLPQLSFAEVHDWGYWGSDTAAMPGGSGASPPAATTPTCLMLSAPVGCSFALAARLHKPLIVGESGMQGVTAAQRTVRARLMRAKMDAAFAAGASGYLVWSVTTAETDGYDLRTTTHDPLITQMHEVAAGLR